MSAASTSRSSTMAGVQRISAMTRFLRAVEFLTELPNQFAFGPCQPIVVNGHDENVLFAPAVAFDLLRWALLAAITFRRPSNAYRFIATSPD